MKLGTLCFVLCLLTCSALMSCGDNSKLEEGEKRGKPMVLATFFPVYFLTNEIAQDSIDLSCPLPDGADPIFWRPSDADITHLREADLIVANGAGFERWVKNISLPTSRVLQSASSLSDDFIYIKETTSHNHGVGGKHSHAGLDGHTWVDPVNARAQAQAILDGLIRLLPNREDDFRRRHQLLDKGLSTLAKKFEALGKSVQGVPLLASHPAYNYLARRFGLNLVTLNLDPGSKLSPGSMKIVKQALKGHEAKVILWESEPHPEIVTQLQAEFGVKCVVFSPLEDPGLCRGPNPGNFLDLMGQNLEKMTQALANR